MLNSTFFVEKSLQEHVDSPWQDWVLSDDVLKSIPMEVFSVVTNCHTLTSTPTAPLGSHRPQISDPPSNDDASGYFLWNSSSSNNRRPVLLLSRVILTLLVCSLKRMNSLASIWREMESMESMDPNVEQQW